MTGKECSALVASMPAAAIHFDTVWDNHRHVTGQRMLEAHASLGEKVAFAEVDCDQEVELAQSIPVLNVPLVAYYRDGKLVAAKIGTKQDIRDQLERVLRGDSLLQRADRVGTRQSICAASLMVWSVSSA